MQATERPLVSGIYPGLSYDDYAALGGHRASSLWPLVRKTPAHYQRRLMAPSAPTEAMVFGTAFHTFVLEPERFAAEYVIGGPINPKTGKAYGRDTKAWAEWEACNPGALVISEEDMEHLRGMRDSIMAHKEAHDILLAPGRETEVSMLWRDEATGLFLQGRLDHFHRPSVLFADLKTTKSVDPREFQRSCEDWGYFMQTAMYWDGLRALTGRKPYMPIVIPVEKTPPKYFSAVYEISVSDLAHGREQYHFALRRWKWCMDNGEWPAYPGIMSLSPPKWAMDRPYEVIE